MQFNNDFVCIDFETANSNRVSVCQIGIVVFKNNKIVNEREWYIKPPKEYNYFSNFNVRIHGITEKDVADKLEFNEIWHEIEPLISNKVIVAHNASFDISVLRSLIEYYNIELSELYYICTCNIAKKTWDKQINYTLANLAHQLGFTFNHHDAHSDAKACGQILIEAMKVHNSSTIDELINKINMRIGYVCSEYYIPCSVSKAYKMLEVKNDKIVKKELIKDIKNVNENSPFYNKHVCFTGTLISMTRQNAAQTIVNIGGIPDNTVTKNTNYLVLGLQDYSRFADGLESSKTKKAKEYINKGQQIEIIDEDTFVRMLV